MPLSVDELVDARETVRSLLDDLQIGSYLFEVEPKEDDWEVHIDCRAGDDWQSTVVRVGRTRLASIGKEPTGREQLLAVWRRRLGACTQG